MNNIVVKKEVLQQKLLSYTGNTFLQKDMQAGYLYDRRFYEEWTLIAFRVGSAEIWTRILGFNVQSANHYTTEPEPR